MKKVRFETPFRASDMNETDCQSPRPFLLRNAEYNTCSPDYVYTKPVQFTSDPVHRFEHSNSSPYPIANKTSIPSDKDTWWLPSNELDLSMLDGGIPRQPPTKINTQNFEACYNPNISPQVLISQNIKNDTPPNILCKDNDFFIKRDTLAKYMVPNITTVSRNFNRLSMDKENNPMIKKQEMRLNSVNNVQYEKLVQSNHTNKPNYSDMNENGHCNCHHCNRSVVRPLQMNSQNIQYSPRNCNFNRPEHVSNCSPCSSNCHSRCNCEKNSVSNTTVCKCCQSQKSVPINGVDKKTWAIEKYEQNQNQCTDIEQQKNITKEKREPTVSDLFKIIKLQNEQLQLLQDKVDKFIVSHQDNRQAQEPLPVQSYVTEQIVKTMDAEHKISIGVMTSFEMVRTSTIINKEVVKQTSDNAQIQCNHSLISIKETSKSQPVNLNFLDGLTPVEKNVNMSKVSENRIQSIENANEEKTFNELSLYNVHVDATTPVLSPEQSLYLDVRDYSDSDSTGDENSNVGWTYYNKVMTHVNGMLQDSDMPSSASALYRQTRQQSVQLQIDKTNVSVTKRVKFGDDPLGIHQPHIYTASSDTSMRMNQLAAKYLKNGPVALPKPPISKPSSAPIDMSFATRNYMERHKLLQSQPVPSKSPVQENIPRFLDITALKQQSKLL